MHDIRVEADFESGLVVTTESHTHTEDPSSTAITTALEPVAAHRLAEALTAAASDLSAPEPSLHGIPLGDTDALVAVAWQMIAAAHGHLGWSADDLAPAKMAFGDDDLVVDVETDGKQTLFVLRNDDEELVLAPGEARKLFGTLGHRLADYAAGAGQ